MAQDDAAWAKVNTRTAESIEAKLKRKAEIYDKLQRGKTGGLSSAQLDNLLVDFDSKDDEKSSSEESASDDDTNAGPDDPLVEIMDEFGRTRQVRRSEVPREYQSKPEQSSETEGDHTVLRGRHINHFPVYEPSAERVAKIMEQAKDDPLDKHYDATNENRAKGAAFYQFSGDEETRRQQMSDLLDMREETSQARERHGAEEKAQEEPENEEKILNKATAKRKRELEERRAQLEAKRRKKDSSVPKVNESTLDAMDFLAKMARELGDGGTG